MTCVHISVTEIIFIFRNYVLAANTEREMYQWIEAFKVNPLMVLCAS